MGETKDSSDTDPQAVDAPEPSEAPSTPEPTQDPPNEPSPSEPVIMDEPSASEPVIKAEVPLESNDTSSEKE